MISTAAATPAPTSSPPVSRKAVIVQHMRDEEGENSRLEPGVGSHQHHIADQ